MGHRWKNITKEELLKQVKELSKGEICEKYGITQNQLQYKRKKFGITMSALVRKDFLKEQPLQTIIASIPTRDLLLNRANIDLLAKAITQYAFRSGPALEQIHVEGKVTDEDMKELNKYMTSRFAGLLQKIFDGQWDEIAEVFRFYASLSSDWDKAIADTRDFDIGFEK